MAIKQTAHIIRGLRKDFSDSKQPKEYAIDAKNIRITNRENSTLLSITNEKGTQEITLNNNISGNYLGHTTINDILVLFTRDTNTDYIYKINLSNNTNNTLFEGKLSNESIDHIEALGVYESEDIQKVYWVDGVSQPRMINIKDETKRTDVKEFDFIQELQLNETIKVEKSYSSGSFNSGVIQYAFNYYNKNGQESNIVEVTPINYISYEDRGAAPNDYVSNSFKITINNVDTNFDYLRLYSIHRTALDAIPEVKVVKDIKVEEPKSIPTIKTESFNIPNFNNESLYKDTYELINNSYKDWTINLNIMGVIVGEDSFEYNTDFNLLDYDLDTTNNILNISIIALIAHVDNKFYIYPEINNTNGLGNLLFIEDLKREGISINFIKRENSTPSVSYYNEGATILDSHILAPPKEIKLNSSRILENTIIDNGLQGYTIDPSELLFKGGEYIIPKTLSQKDGTLFFGNIKILENSLKIDSDILEKWRNTKTIGNNLPMFIWMNNHKIIGNIDTENEYYPYKSYLGKGDNTTFKSKEEYRLGIQFQNKYGKWSEPILYKDSVVSNDINEQYSTPKLIGDKYYAVSAGLRIPKNIIEIALNKNYVKVRPVVVFPKEEERNILAQGILCPSVYNIKDRASKSYYAQSSWFLRPNIPTNLFIDNYNINEYNYNTYIEKGSWAEFRHNYALPSNEFRNCEIQSMAFYEKTDNINLDNPNNWEYTNIDYFGVDKSIVTFHSPEIELNKITDLRNTKLRIVGYVPFTYNASDIKIITSTASPLNETNFLNFIEDLKEDVYAGNNFISGLLWKDWVIYDAKYNYDQVGTSAYMVYPWQKKGSILNDNRNTGYSILKEKKLSNLKFSKNTSYLSTPYLFNNTDIQLGGNNNNVKFNFSKIYWKNPSDILDSFSYLSDVDTSLTPNLEDRSYTIDPVVVEYGVDYTGSSLPLTQPVKGNYKDGYAYIAAVSSLYDGSTNNEKTNEQLFYSYPFLLLGTNRYSSLSASFFSKDPIVMRYKTTPHIVINLNGEDLIESRTIILPRSSNSPTEIEDYDSHLKMKHLIKQDVIDVSPQSGYLWIGEIYRDPVPNKFSGQDYTNNIWYPAGNSVRLDSNNDINSDSIIIYYTQGDTFYSRFDSLKTYPYTLEDPNSIVEIGSFMVETRINLDARYDRNIGKKSNLVMTPTNFNLFNDVYNQKNNFFNYRIIDKDIADNTKFPNTIVWSKQKFAGADVDAWTNINMASSLDLDGTKGELTKLVSFKNEIFSFQPEAINHILFNSRVQIPTSDGVPIELTNAYKVDGARQLSSVGSSNPLAIKSTDRGIYYMDNITKGIYVFNGQQSESLSDKLGMSSWVKEQNIDSYKVNYDKINQDIYFINNDNCLSYSEKLGEFESFFDYNNSEIFNVKDGTYAIKSNKLYKLFEGNYNRFFEYDSKPFWVTFTHNENPFNDKIYNTLEFRSDTYNYITKDEKGNAITPYWDLSNNSAFNNIIVENEYQLGSENLDFKRYTPSNLKRKFRIWRANIPRDNKNKRDRIRNTWTNITLKASNPSNTKTELHDLIVNYSM